MVFAEINWNGNGSFDVQLNGEDGVITLAYGDSQTVELKVEKGDFVVPQNSSIMVNGVEVTVTGAKQDDETGKWTVNYTYKLTGDQPHNKAGLTGEDDSLDGTITITVTDATGDENTGSLTVEVHDDGPSVHVVKNRIEFEKGESGGAKEIADLDGLFSVQSGADGEASREYGLRLKDGKPSMDSG